MFKADMHVHTTASDGVFSPEEAVKWAADKNIDTIAVTDHDTVNGLEEAFEAGRKYGVNIIPGAEMSCLYKEDEVHIVGLFIDYENEDLKKKFKELSEARTKRGAKIAENLRKEGIDISYEEILKEAQCDSVGKPHVARVLVKKGYAEDMDDAFKKYLVRGKPGDVERKKITVPEAAELIHNAGGIAIVAHPGIIRHREYAEEILQYDIDGMEVIHSIHSEETIKRIQKLVDDRGLLKSAGSDCHGKLIDGVPMIGDYYLTEEEFNALKKRRDERMKTNGEE